MRQTRSDRLFDACNIAFMILLIIVMLYPLYFTVIASFSDPYAVVRGDVYLLPKGFSLDAYKNVLLNESVWRGYSNTIIYTLAGTLFNLALTLSSAYALSKRDLPGRSALSWYFLITMYFGGGLIPTYLQVRDLGLLNKPFTIIVLGGLSVYNMIVTRIFFQTTIPDDVYEAARIDGASDFRQFFRIALPLSAPIVAVMALYYGVARWNDYYTALIYISNTDYFPLQMVLRSILIQNQNAMAIMLEQAQTGADADAEYVSYMMRRTYMANSMKYSLIFIASAPLLAAYPFIQKYFVKGVMIGSLKG